MADESLVMQAMWANAEGVKQALAEGANPNAVDTLGNPVLILAVSKDMRRLMPFQVGRPLQPDATRILLEAGADADVKKKGGETPLERVLNTAIYYNEGDRHAFKNLIPLMKLLLRHGATMPEDALSKVPPEHKEELRAEAAYQRRRPLLEARYGPGGPMYKRGTMAPKDAGRRRKTVRRRKTKSRRRQIR